MTTEIAWIEGVPSAEALYLVAIELGANSGYYAFSYWDGSNWSQSFPEKVIGFFPANQLIDQLNIKWPKPEPEGFDDSIAAPKPVVDGEWQEV
jgi:hypothetical protein